MPPGRRLDIDGLYNARDLGGLPLARGGTTPFGVFYRSETLDRVTADGWEQLRAAGIRTVVDLRRAGERKAVHTAPDWLTLVHIDLDGEENRAFWADYEPHGLDGTALYYLAHLAAMPERTVEVLTALATAPPGGALFHCMGGRDRTGLVALVLLTIAGVEPAAIVDDYLETMRRARDPGSAGRLFGEDEVDELLARHGTTTERAFREALAGLDVPALPAQVREQIVTWRGATAR